MCRKTVILVIIFTLCITFAGCRSKAKDEVTEAASSQAYSEASLNDNIVIGFSQLGAESDWRSANTESMKLTFTAEKGYDLIFDDGQQKQANQIMAIRRFIQQEVDFIVLAPVTEEGWDTVLQEAKDAGIPVVIIDRMACVEDELFTCWLGSNFELEGKKAAEWLKQYATVKGIAPEELHIVNIQGTIGASAQIGRTKGLEEAAQKYGWDLLAEVSGDFTQTKGREVMEDFLKKYDNINVVYCENDNEAFGAIEAIEAAGKKVGSDIAAGEIMIISFDGVNKRAVSDVVSDRITCIVECNPIHGPHVQQIIETLRAGGVPEKFAYVDEGMICGNDTVRTVNVDGVDYGVTIIH